MIKKIYLPIIIAASLWFIMFSPWTKEYVNFWLGMSFSAGILSFISVYTEKQNLKEIYSFKYNYIIIGLISAFILYLIFFIGNFISQLIFSFAGKEVNNIYNNKVQADYLIISLLLLLWIGPAEELFWRGFIQRNMNKIYNNNLSLFITSLIYALVHIWSFNFMLVMAAFVCGLFWGFLYNKYQSIVPVIISHSLWDFIIFILFPIT